MLLVRNNYNSSGIPFNQLQVFRADFIRANGPIGILFVSHWSLLPFCSKYSIVVINFCQIIFSLQHQGYFSTLCLEIVCPKQSEMTPVCLINTTVGQQNVGFSVTGGRGVSSGSREYSLIIYICITYMIIIES